jgi:anti-sigma regulatory factor (Ser/Thr protein kinase)
MLRFEPVAPSVPAAREYVLTTSSVRDPHSSQRLAILASELVTNAVLHARTAFFLKVEQVNDSIRVTVTDQSLELPVLKNHGAMSATGRGLHLVDSLADRWGFEPLPDGKAVWFEITDSQHDPE